jgi:cytochrome c oxidase cbb3-type subunit III
MNNFFKKSVLHKKNIILLLAGILFVSPVLAQPPVPDTMANPLAQVLVIIIAVLAVAIGILANVVNGAASVFREKMKKERETSGNAGNLPKAILVFIFLIGSGFLLPVTAQTVSAVAPAGDTTINGLTPFVFYLLITVIGVEIIIMLALIYQLKFLMGLEKVRVIKLEKDEPSFSQKVQVWWEKINASKSIEQEADIDLQHDYDGIRELDNKVPPWWRWAFIFTIVFGLGYLWRYHVAKSAPLQKEEFVMAMQEAEKEKEEYLKIAGDKVDESTVAMLDANGVAAGKSLFSQNCIACHGPDGQGGAVGPNLSDEYWIHGGKLNDIFKSIKYGWQEKGMRSWKEDFSPVQMAQLSSFIMNLKGVKLPNPREPQGELYIEVADSSTSAVKENIVK